MFARFHESTLVFLLYITVINFIIFGVLLFIHALVFFNLELKQFFSLRINSLISFVIIFFILLLVVFRLLILFQYYDSTSQIILSLFNGCSSVYLNIRSNLYLSSAFALSVGQTLISMLLIIVISVHYTVAFQKQEVLRFLFYSIVLYVCGIIFVTTSHIIIMFVSFEGILIPTSVVLDLYSKTLRARDATKMMIVLTQVGALLLFFVLYNVFGLTSLFTDKYYELALSRSSLNFIALLVFFGFGTKMPVWPFYSWLPEAHVEVSTNFSIVLSGVSIKFAFLGYLRFVEVLGLGDIYWLPAVFCFIGAVDAALKMDTESDIKKLVALQTVAEMQLLIGFVALDHIAFMDFIIFVLPMHCWISTIGFILVDLIMKRYHTRNLEHLYGVFAESPRLVKLIFFIVFILGSIPGTGAYSVEFLVQIFSSTLMFNTVFFMILQFFVVIWSRNIWWVLWGGDPLSHSIAQPFNFTKSELSLICILLLYLIPSILFIDVTGIIV